MLIGESGLLFALTRAPQPGVFSHPGGSFPPLVFVLLAAYAALDAGRVWTSRRGLAVAWRNSPGTGGLLIFVL